jgi:anti-sigma factor RsiW
MSKSTQHAGAKHVGGLWCHEVLALLTRHLDGDLNDDELAAVKAHVAGCDNCARFGGAFADAVAKLRADVEGDVDVELGGDNGAFTARVLAAIDAE